ncbi:MAG: acyltransferase family protein, partial [Acidimicrobiales bacterium]
MDGIRAFAVMAVLLYHFGIAWVGGGLLGVDVFFVLSGFLITSLLCRELAASRTVRLRRFWAQRARRLLPALFVLVLGVAGYAAVFTGSVDLASIRADALSTLVYVANWHFVFSDQGYFHQAAAPSPLLHTWSLAVEEQYYLIWPLVALFVVRRCGVAKLAVTAAAGAIGSAALMAAMWGAGFSVDRLYYGTDTRAQALLVGSFLGAIGPRAGATFAIVPDRWVATLRQRRWWSVPGMAGGLFLAWAWHALAGQEVFLYRGGFLVVAVAAGGVILTCVTVPKSLLPRLCSLPALVFVGRVSYGLYLYHWPLFLAINHAHTGLSGAGLLAARLVATFAAATVSFFVLEEPVRTGRLFRGAKGLGAVAVATVATVCLVVLATVVPAAPSVAAPAGYGLTTAERQSLSVAGAFGRDPIRFAIVGDSVALTLGVGLTAGSTAHYGVRVFDGGELGCDLDDVEVRLSDTAGPATPGCLDWPKLWQHGIDAIRPDVVGMLIGRWEVSDHLWRGRWVHVGQPDWDAHLVGELDEAVDVLSSRGARVVLFTMPYMDPPNEAADGTPFVENDPSRARAFNRLLAQVADSRRGTVTLIDLNRLLDPAGHYQAQVDGVT